MIDLLDELAKEARRPPVPVQEPVDEAHCHVCKSRRPRITCRACERPACSADAWVMFGLCVACAPEEKMARWHKPGKAEGENWLG